MAGIKWDYELKKTALDELFFMLKNNNKISLKSNDKDLLNIVYSLNKNPKFIHLNEDLNGFKLLCFYSKIFKNTDIKKDEQTVSIDYAKNKGSKNIYSEANLMLSINNNFLYSTAYSLDPYIKEHQITFPNLCFDYNKTINDNINIATSNHNITHLEAVNIFIKQKNIIIDNGGTLQKCKLSQNIQNLNNISSNSILNLNTINNTTISTSPQSLSKQRDSITEAFDHKSKDWNLFLFQDGTGTGKSHNVVHNFITSSTPDEKHNLIFMSPQKGQMFLNKDVYLEASKKDIPLLYARSIKDFEDWNHKDYLSLNLQTHEFDTLRDFFSKLFKLVHPQSINRIDTWMIKMHKDRKNRLKDDRENEINITFSKLNSLYNSLNDIESHSKIYSFLNQNELNEKKREYHRHFRSAFVNMAHFFALHLPNSILIDIFKSGSIYNGFKQFSKFKNQNKIYEFIFKMISFAMPFEAAKYKNSIIYLTIDKSNHLLYISEEYFKRPDEKSLQSMDLETIISGYDINYKSNVNQFCLMNNNSVISDFLQNKYFIKKKTHYFSQNNIGFSVVIDEEHLSYDRLSSAYTSKEITSNYEGFIQERLKVNIIHALTAMNRWKNNVTDPNFDDKGFINL